MSNELLSRIEAQRLALKVINATVGQAENLSGLSRAAIDRWANLNSVRTDSQKYEALIEISKKLFFLANHSQQSVTDEYQVVESEIHSLLNKLHG